MGKWIICPLGNDMMIQDDGSGIRCNWELLSICSLIEGGFPAELSVFTF